MYHLPCGKDEFHKYTWKKVTWIDLSTLALPVCSNSDGPLVADMDSVINRAIMKAQLKQSTKLHDLVEEHNKVHVTVCTMSEGENIPVTPHGGSDALENPQPGELSETHPLLQD
ncbi:hypothetical protein AV530_004905 [Patagioenas fasciata monilis]|uniref:Uncharacterized protein n=1 Tax=Patagioenas fasciata monilis TaxID=372326 RepID=A0A1V4K384_PATFA|nr:hypothetical protein AV530_004905 [Patagioenas fasciata monilis]